MRSAIVILLFAAAAVRAQQIGQNTPPGGGTATFTTSTQLVVESVVVTDKKGSPIEGLTAKDFTVTENGVPQEIRFFDHQDLPLTPGARRTRGPSLNIFISTTSWGERKFRARRRETLGTKIDGCWRSTST
jgi:hypothetical protein